MSRVGQGAFGVAHRGVNLAGISSSATGSLVRKPRYASTARAISRRLVAHHTVRGEVQDVADLLRGQLNHVVLGEGRTGCTGRRTGWRQQSVGVGRRASQSSPSVGADLLARLPVERQHADDIGNGAGLIEGVNLADDGFPGASVRLLTSRWSM